MDLVESTRARLSGAPNATPRRLANLDRAIAAFLAGDDNSDSLPYSLFIEASNGCNLRCPLCPTGAGTLRRPVQDMDIDGYRSLVDEVANDVFEVHFAFFGEPLFNPHLGTMVRYAAERGLSTRLMTNGTLVTEQRARSLVVAGLDRVTVSVDGLDQGSYEQYRVGGQFERVIRCLGAFRTARLELGLQRPWIEAQLLAMRHTEGLLARARTELREHGADEVKVKATSIELVHLDDEQLWDFLPVDGGLRYYERGSDGHVAFRHDRVADTIPACPAMYLEPGVIMSSGETAMCCRDPDGDHGFGSAFADGFGAVWNGPAMRSARARFAEPADRPPICRGCPILALDGFQLEPLARSDPR